MNTIPFTTTELSSPTTPLTPSYSDALRYLAEVAAAQEWTDAMHSPKHLPARRRRHSRKASRAAGPPGLPIEIKELVAFKCEPWAHTKSIDVQPQSPAVELGKLVDQVFAEEEENDDDEWIYGP
ncbi:unnamed protein product, partial [Rhizoctonia solani]